MNTPNKLTIARMIIVPFLVIFLLTGWGGEANRYISLTLFVVASVTDWFDGYLARKNNLVTNFGKFMDPLADKLLVCSAMICMIDLKRLSAWFVIIIIAREFIISGFRLIADKTKLDMLQNLAEKGNGKSVSDMMPYLMSAAASGKKNGLHFSQNEISAVLEVMKAGKTPQEASKIDRIVNLMRMIH